MFTATIRYLIYLTPDGVKNTIGTILSAAMFAATVCGIFVLA